MSQPISHLAQELRLAGDGQRYAVLRQAITDGRTTDAERDNHVKAFLDYARAMNWPLDRLWACGDGARLAWGCASLKSPGRSAMLMLPYPTELDVAQIAALVERIMTDEAESGTNLVQSLLFLEDLGNRAALESIGFREIAVLHYLEVALSPSPSVSSPSSPPLQAPAWVNYSPTHHADFCTLIENTYQDSLDCPGLASLRKIEDVVAGHKGAGRFNPDYWFLLRDGNAHVACILFGASPLRPSAELVYMGVHPRYRGQGVGHFVLAHGIEAMHRSGIRGITLAVDARNAPALRLYESVGFRRTHVRRAMVRRASLNA